MCKPGSEKLYKKDTWLIVVITIFGYLKISFINYQKNMFVQQSSQITGVCKIME